MATTRLDTTIPASSEPQIPAAMSNSSPTLSSSPSDRRSSMEWDAAKVPPSRFQKRKGSIYAVPSSRDGHIDSNYNTKFHEKHKELWKSADAATSTGNKDSSSSSKE